MNKQNQHLKTHVLDIELVNNTFDWTEKYSFNPKLCVQSLPSSFKYTLTTCYYSVINYLLSTVKILISPPSNG